jgi:2-keto-3-deoxy-6-phosphogluconate aldolase
MKHMNTRLIGILRTKPNTKAVNAIKAISSAFNSGIKAVEITSNSDHWQEVVQVCSENKLNIGVGSIKSGILAKEAILHGAKFLVCPGVFEDAISIAHEYGIPIIPGVYSESQKFFPASVKTHEELYKAISEPFRDEIVELKHKGWNIVAYGSDEYNLISTKSFVIVSTPTEFYNEYFLIRNKKPYCNIVVKLPEGPVGFDRLKSIVEFSNKLGIKTYAVGGITDNNINEVLTIYGAHGICPGKGMFDPNAILNGDWGKVKADVEKYIIVTRGFELAVDL